MANPSSITMFARLTNGNVTTPFPGDPDVDEGVVSGHDFIIVFQEWDYGVVTKAQAIALFNFTHADDDADLVALNGWYQAATDKSAFLDVLEGRFILARQKNNISGVLDLDGALGYAVKATLIGGADGLHSLRDTGPVATRFNSWT